MSTNPSSRIPSSTRASFTNLSFLGAVALLLALVGCAATDSTSPPDAPEPPSGPLVGLAWLSGTWSDAEPGDTLTEERWSTPRGGSMLGTNRTLSGETTAAFEFLRIEARQPGTIVYVAQPSGSSPGVDFPLTDLEGTRAVFENPEHDFPQRLEYALADGILTVTVSAEADGELRGFRMRWRRTGD